MMGVMVWEIVHQKEKKSSDSLREWGCLFSESVNDRSDGMGECAFNLRKIYKERNVIYE